MEREGTDVQRKDRLWKDRILLCGGEDRSVKDRIMPCGGNVTSACIGVHRMSVWSTRHYLWEDAGGQMRLDTVWQGS